jgi:hypothetical protein
MMLNANNIGLVRYKTVKVATLDSINQIFFFIHQLSKRSQCQPVVGAVARC